MLNVFIDGLSPGIGQTIALSKEESHHLTAVLRVKKEDRVVLFNRHNQAWKGTIAAIHKLTTVIVEETLSSPARNIQIHLAQALPKGKAMEDLIRKAVEIGCHHFYPLTTERTEVHLKGDRLDKKKERWDNVAIEACKQSSNLQVPTWAPLQSLPGFLEQMHADEFSLLFVASLQEDSVFFNMHSDSKQVKTIVWLVGPEGDFSENEYALIKEKGFTPIRLASHVLRVETAVTYALSVTDFLLRVNENSNTS